MNDDSNFEYPAARKNPSGDSPSAPFNTGSQGWSAPLSPDHALGTGPYTPEDWDTPYGSPMPGYVPPPPPGRRGTTSPQQRRWRAGLLLLLAALVALVGVGVLFLLPHFGEGTTTSTPNGPVAVATDKPTPTATLKPGQTPLPTRIPTATPFVQPTALPGQPTPTPLPTATPIPYASHASVTFTAASKSISTAKSAFTAATSGGDIGASTANVSVGLNVTSAGPYQAPETDNGSQVSFTINVTNNTGASRNAPITVVVTSSTSDGHGGNVSCTITTAGVPSPVPNGGTATQTCVEPQQAEPAASYNISINGWKYVGSSPAGGSPAVWTVPATCASDNLAAAENAAGAKLDADLAAGLPRGTTRFYLNKTYDTANATCTPAAKTTANNPIDYTVSVGGSGTETFYSNSAVQAFEANQLQLAAAAVLPKGSYAVIPAHTVICSGGGSPNLGAASATSVPITCAASGLAGWKWTTSSASSTISPLITGEPKSAAISTVNAVPGVKSGSASMSLIGGSYVPKGTSQIGYTILTP